MEEEDLRKIESFLTRGNGERIYSKRQAHVLYGWRWNTVLLYNSAVRKFLKFKLEESNASFDLPASVDDIYNFCLWAGRTREGPTSEDVTSVTVSKYLHGLRAWHLYHFERFPDVNEGTIKQMLIASKRIDVSMPKKTEKKPVLLKHLVNMAVELSKGGEKEIAVLDTVLVAFWGLARLGELCGDKEDTSEIIKKEDIIWLPGERREATITLRGAKTAKTGEIQKLQVRELNHLLCPVAALDRRMSRAKGHDPIFSFCENGEMKTLNKQWIMKTCQSFWEKESYKGLTGHSFRVGGASFRFALGVRIEDICIVGRWKSDAYRLYIKAYSKKELAETLRLLNELQSNKLH